MPRPHRCRFIDSYPDHWSFAALDDPSRDTVIMSLDEYETILPAGQGRAETGGMCRENGRCRTTITAIYESARKKLAQCLVDGKTLRIEGGSYKLSNHFIGEIKPKGEKEMRVAVTFDNGEVFSTSDAQSSLSSLTLRRKDKSGTGN